MADIDANITLGTSPAPAPVPPPLPKQRLTRPPMTRAQLTGAIVAVVLSSAVGVGAAFGFDVCAALTAAGVRVAACPVAAP